MPIDRTALQYALDNGIIDEAYLQAQMDMTKRKEYLSQHEFKIWEGKDGRWYTYLPDHKKGRILRRRNTKEEIEDCVVDYWKATENTPLIRDVFREWNDRRLKLNKISKATYDRYDSDFNKFLENTLADRRINTVSQEEWADFLEEMIPTHKLTAKAFANLKGLVRGMLRRAKRRGLITFNIEDMLSDLDSSDREFRKVVKEEHEEVFTEEETEIVVTYLEDHPTMTHLGILLLFATGLRVGELVALKWEDVIGCEAIRIRRTETRVKNDKGKYVPVIKDFPKTQAGVRTVVIPTRFQWILKSLRRMNPFGEWIFIKKGDQRMTENCFRMRLYRVCDTLGIYRKSPHKIRKTYGTILLEANVDERMIIDQMGHTNILTTEKYYHRNRKNINRKRAILDSIGEFDEWGKVIEK